ncbi:MAG: HNH endonuclease [Muribaculaceae bacterium]|nr:HNH endonuclease [Muribaculaceae bacterium]
MSQNGSTYHRLLNTTRWRRLRAHQLELSPFCDDCSKVGLLVPATEVHHIMPVEGAVTPEQMAARTYDQSNLVSLCPSCHTARHKQLGSHKRSKEKTAERVKAEVDAFLARFS